MSPAPRWISISAASALGLGIFAAGAVGVANAMPLVDSTTQAEVPPISTVPGNSTNDVKGSTSSGDVTFPVPTSSPALSTPAPSGPAPSNSPAPSAVEPAPPQPAPVQQAPAPQPASPESVSAASPASVDSVD